MKPSEPLDLVQRPGTMLALHALRISGDQELTLNELGAIVPLQPRQLGRRMFELAEVSWVKPWRAYGVIRYAGRSWIDCEGFAFTLLRDGHVVADVLQRLEELSSNRSMAEYAEATIIEILKLRSERRYRKPFAQS